MGKIMLNGVDYSAPAASGVSGVKGNAESSYRTGNVNITAANIGLGNVNNTADANKSVNYATSAGKATNDGSGNNIVNTYAKKSIYGDTAISMGRSSEGTVGEYSLAIGGGAEASGYISHAAGAGVVASGSYSYAGGAFTIASGGNSHAEGIHTTASGIGSHAEGGFTTSSNYASHALGKYNKAMTAGDSYGTQVGDVFVIGNGTSDTPKSNALRVTYKGDIYGTKAFQSSGADYAEFIKPWSDGNPDEEDRIGYFVTVKNGLLEKARQGDYIAGITSGNPSIVGNADEDYYWRYERDEFNRIVMEDVPESIQQTDEDGKLVFDEETHEPVMVETGKIVKNARMKLAEGYDSSLQEGYIERKDRKEWDYVGMLGVLPVRDDGTCLPDHFCKCSDNGIATLATERGFDTYRVLERISENIVSVILR